eukprot:Opistho-2@2517
MRANTFSRWTCLMMPSGCCCMTSVRWHSRPPSQSTTTTFLSTLDAGALNHRKLPFPKKEVVSTSPQMPPLLHFPHDFTLRRLNVYARVDEVIRAANAKNNASVAVEHMCSELAVKEKDVAKKGF